MARAEPDVAAEVAVQSELVWVGKFLRITIRGAIAHPDQRSRRNFYARDFDVAGRLAIKLLHRTLIAQSLFDHRLDQAAIIPQLLPKRRPLHEDVDHVADEISRGLISSDQQQYRETQDSHSSSFSPSMSASTSAVSKSSAPCARRAAIILPK